MELVEEGPQLRITERGVIEVLTPCPSFNKTLNFRMLNELVKPLPDSHDHSDQVAAMSLALDEKGFYTGVFYQAIKPTYSELKETIGERSGSFPDPRAGLREIMGEFA